MEYRQQKTPKEVVRNGERKEGIMKITDAFTGMLERASEIKHNSAKSKMTNFTTWVKGTVDGISDLIFAESNYVAIDADETRKKNAELETKKDYED